MPARATKAIKERVADKLGISENTARTQLRSVFSKTNVHRQAELIRLVLNMINSKQMMQKPRLLHKSNK